MDDLRDYILNDDSTYDEGVALYHKYANNVILKSRFTNGSAFSMGEQLHYELTKIGKANGIKKEIVIELPGEFIPKPKVNVVEVVQRYLPEEMVNIQGDEITAMIAGYEAEMNTYRIMRAKLANKYHTLTTLEERAANHRHIEEVFALRQKASDNKFSLENYGELPKQDIAPVRSDNAIEIKHMKRLCLDKMTKTRANIRKLLPNANNYDSKLAGYESKLAIHAAEVDEFNKRIRSLQGE